MQVSWSLFCLLKTILQGYSTYSFAFWVYIPISIKFDTPPFTSIKAHRGGGTKAIASVKIFEFFWCVCPLKKILAWLRYYINSTYFWKIMSCKSTAIDMDFLASWKKKIWGKNLASVNKIILIKVVFYVLENRRSSRGGGCAPLHPPPRSALPLYVSGKLLTNPSLKPALTLTSHSYWWWITIQTWVVLLIRSKFSTNQKNCSGLNSDTSSVPNFCSCSSFSCGNQWWCTTESAGCFPTSVELHNKDGEGGTRP